MSFQGSPHMFPMAHKGSSATPYSLPASVHSALATASVNNTSSKKEKVEGRRVNSETDIVIKNKGISRADPEKCIETLVTAQAQNSSVSLVTMNGNMNTPKEIENLPSLIQSTDASTESSVVLKTPPKPARASASYSLVEHITIVLSAWQSNGSNHRFDNNRKGQFFKPDPTTSGICQQDSHHEEPKMLNGLGEETLKIMARAGKRDLRAGVVQETWVEHTMAKTKLGKRLVTITEKPRFFIGDVEGHAL
ncbi:hypothetical protein C365_06968 [Cryptococcus neoformans Bt85]|nr:hypothetical protein C365_06968 [Cryptococcus neoformans var. grubii Bt85]OXM75480.1 hypothetical protein C364_06891 [Cryptococcus neoformans var. grubii Bt63]